MGLYLGSQKVANLGETFNFNGLISEYNKCTQDSYSAISSKGGTIPQVKSIQNLSASIMTIPTSYGIDENGNLGKEYTEENLNFENVKRINDYGLYCGFYKCNNIKTVSFPQLTSIGTYGMHYAFQNCTQLTAIHFRADARAMVEAQEAYSSKFGATNATIYFDL